jgi:hypothetical protein
MPSLKNSSNFATNSASPGGSRKISPDQCGGTERRPPAHTSSNQPSRAELAIRRNEAIKKPIRESFQVAQNQNLSRDESFGNAVSSFEQTTSNREVYATGFSLPRTKHFFITTSSSKKLHTANYSFGDSTSLIARLSFFRVQRLKKTPIYLINLNKKMLKSNFDELKITHLSKVEVVTSGTHSCNNRKHPRKKTILERIQN